MEELPLIRFSRTIVLLMGFVFIVFAIVTPFRYFVAQPFIVSGASMVPTFHPREYLVIDRMSIRSHEPKRGDVVVFKYPLDPSTYFIKRIVGLPGETIVIEGDEVRVARAGETPHALNEPYRNKMSDAPTEITLKNDEYFVMGDNRSESADSRVWGPLQKRYIIGEPVMRLFPFSEIEMDPGAYEFVE
jgi:signal peptidase I